MRIGVRGYLKLLMPEGENEQHSAACSREAVSDMFEMLTFKGDAPDCTVEQHPKLVV